MYINILHQKSTSKTIVYYNKKKKIDICHEKYIRKSNKNKIHMEKESYIFLQRLAEKTFYWQDITLHPSMSMKKFQSKSAEFKKYKIIPADFRKVLAIISKEPLFVRPKISLMGYVEGYWVYEINMFSKEKELVLLFGEEQLPGGHTLKSLFDVLCHSKSNRQMFQILPKEEKIKSEFEEYSY